MSEESNSELFIIYEKLKTLITDSTSELGNKIDTLTDKLEEAEKRLKFLENENKILNKQVQDNLRETKKNNIIIFGLEEEETEDLYNIILDLFNTTLEIPVRKEELNYAYRFGRQTENTRPVVVKFVTFHKKLDVLKKGYLLKGNSISITNDLTKEERENQKILRRHQKNALEQRLDAKIKKNNLIINNTIYSVSDLLNLEKEQIEPEARQQTENPRQNQQQKTTNRITKGTTTYKQTKITAPTRKKEPETKTRVNYGLRSGTDTKAASPSASGATGTGRPPIKFK